MKYDNLDAGIAAYSAYLVEDYIGFNNRAGFNGANERVAKFAESIEVKKGSKYIKIIVDRSVRAFIVASDNDKKFKKGDLLKAASWAAPAKNFARGNVLEGKFSGGWTGAS